MPRINMIGPNSDKMQILQLRIPVKCRTWTFPVLPKCSELVALQQNDPVRRFVEDDTCAKPHHGRCQAALVGCMPPTGNHGRRPCTKTRVTSFMVFDQDSHAPHDTPPRGRRHRGLRPHGGASHLYPPPAETPPVFGYTVHVSYQWSSYTMPSLLTRVTVRSPVHLTNRAIRRRRYMCETPPWTLPSGLGGVHAAHRQPWSKTMHHVI